MAGSVTPLTKKRSLEDDDGLVEPGSQSKKSRLAASPSSTSASCSSSCSSSSDSDSEYGSDETIPLRLPHRPREPMNLQYDDETSSSGESSSCSSCSSSSSSSSSSSDGGSESEDEEGSGDESTTGEIISIPQRRPPPKPSIGLSRDSALRTRLASFLPELRSANEDLEKDISTGNVPRLELDHDENGRIDGQYIEMDLGLGVLEEKADDDETISASSSESESSVSDNDDDNNDTQPAKRTQSRTHQKASVMNKLMGNKSKTKRPNIEEMAS
ncbi:hypothetical protein FQN50_000736 [Emmonsiellopsis sp. PD_5]|nr:hypothetical protein FQN50_000736 [Emmonsiellopsis sp. PD_5]